MNGTLVAAGPFLERQGAKGAKDAKKKMNGFASRPSRPLRLCVRISLTESTTP
jgi:hypothetical protein